MTSKPDTGQKLLQGIGRFSETDMALLESKIIRRTFVKDHFLLNKGQVGTSIFYLLSGNAYQFNDHDDVEENIIGLYTATDWCLNPASFAHQQPSTSSIKAYTALEVAELTVTSIHELINTSPAFFQLGKVLEQSMSRVQYFDNDSTAQEKYQHLLQTRPELFQQFPLKMIASYLKITPETLSRVRNLR